MRSALGYLVVAIVLAGAAAVLWRSSEFEQRIAAAERDLVTLRFDKVAEAAAAAPSRLAALMPGTTESAASAAALGKTSAYWQGNYDEIAADPAAKMLSANAAYRAMRRDGGTWQTVVGRLDSIAKIYGDVLRDDPSNADAAFNYEYVVRLRANIAARRQALTPVDAAASGTTLHGGVGAPPAESDGKKFKMIVPMRPDERQEAERAGKGGTRVRKG